MRVSRRYNDKGASFEQVFKGLIDSKVDEFVNKRYSNKRKAVVDHV